MRRRQPKPCPCCGNAELYTGHLDGTSMGVKCMRWVPKTSQIKGCGLRLKVNYPEYMPRGISSLKALDAYLLAEAVKRWDRRTEK